MVKSGMRGDANDAWAPPGGENSWRYDCPDEVVVIVSDEIEA